MANEKRLIDANAFAECLERMTKTAYPNLFPGLLEAIDYAKDFPPVDAVEVVHGRTEVIEPFEVTLTARCCLCGVAMGNLDNYCPNCGAKMDGERRTDG